MNPISPKPLTLESAAKALGVKYTNTTTKLGVMDSMSRAFQVLDVRGARATADELAAAGLVVEQMAGALAAVRMLRQLGGMMHGSREVVLIACDAADEALAAFNGQQS